MFQVTASPPGECGESRMAGLTHCARPTLGFSICALGMGVYCLTTQGQREVILKTHSSSTAAAPLCIWNVSPMK